MSKGRKGSVIWMHLFPLMLRVEISSPVSPLDICNLWTFNSLVWPSNLQFSFNEVMWVCICSKMMILC